MKLKGGNMNSGQHHAYFQVSEYKGHYFNLQSHDTKKILSNVNDKSSKTTAVFSVLGM